MRKRTNALRTYQRTLNNEELRSTKKTVHRDVPSSNKGGKTNSLKQHCTITTPNNPWNEVYRLAAGKTRETLTLTTLIKPDGSRT
jgi:hypothetical protein